MFQSAEKKKKYMVSFSYIHSFTDFKKKKKEKIKTHSSSHSTSYTSD